MWIETFQNLHQLYWAQPFVFVYPYNIKQSHFNTNKVIKTKSIFMGNDRGMGRGSIQSSLRGKGKGMGKGLLGARFIIRGSNSNSILASGFRGMGSAGQG